MKNKEHHILLVEICLKCNDLNYFVVINSNLPCFILFKKLRIFQEYLNTVSIFLPQVSCVYTQLYFFEQLHHFSIINSYRHQRFCSRVDCCSSEFVLETAFDGSGNVNQRLIIGSFLFELLIYVFEREHILWEENKG